MTLPSISRRRALTLALASLGALALVLVLSCAKAAPTLTTSNTISIDDLAKLLADSTTAKPALIHVGVDALYRSGHIPGSVYAGQGSKPEGLAGLKRTLASVPAGQPVVLYCGCCPWTDCPNVRPAFQAAKEAGRADVRVLYVSSNLERDWIDKGLPATKGE